jgi:LuxR family maltose regulon positive regulatory protein
MVARQPFAVFESKLTPRLARRELVPRAALLRRLEASGSTPVVAVVAAPGYGKTTLLTQWVERDPRPFAWLSIDAHDNDPAVLLTYIAVALDRVEPIDPGVFDALESPGASVAAAVVPRLGSALAGKALPVVLVLDDVHLLHNRECLDAVVALVEHLPGASQLAIASRGEPPFPVARLRAEGCVAEIGQEDLAMDPHEAGSLLRTARPDISDADVAELTRRTEGWPVALCLAVPSQNGAGSRAASGPALGGDDSFLVDYVQSVLLSQLSRTEIRFLTRTAVLDRMSGPLCDAILEGAGSAERLESFERSNLLVIPLDRRRRWYRYHHLFRELLRAALERREPGLARDLARRAARWCEENGLPDPAIEYAIEAGDVERAARLIAHRAVAAYRGGRLAALQRWLGWVDDNELIERYPAIAVLGAWVHALTGNPAAAERWAAAAERGPADATMPDGSGTIEGWLALLRAVLCRDGVARMRADAELALARLPMGSQWRATAHLLLGTSHLLAGDSGLADATLAAAVEAGEDTGATLTASIALAERAIVAIGREEWSQAEDLADRARSISEKADLDDALTGVLRCAVAARVAIHRGQVGCAREELARAQRLRPQLTYILPSYAIQIRLELVRAYTALTDVAGARTVLREVGDLLRRRPHLGVLGARAEELAAQLDMMRADVIGASSLTGAELRLLPQLATHHSFREIGEHLHLSPHTVKTQAIAIYRKFGVSSRSQAIQHAHDLGLLVT